MQTKNLIPIFFSSDDNYVPYLSVALTSLIENASSNNNYLIYILNNGLQPNNITKLKALQKTNVQISFVDVTKKLQPIVQKLGLRDYYTVAIYFRLFIASMFPEYDKVLYLDSDITILGDVAKLYEIDLKDNLLGAVVEQVVESTPELYTYTKEALNVEHEKYFNSGILSMNLKEYRKQNIEEKFVNMLKHNFKLIAPDQDYLNYLCKDQVIYLDKSWNKECVRDGYKGEIYIIHYAYFKKPWNDLFVKYRNFFWKYAKKSPFYNELNLKLKNSLLNSIVKNAKGPQSVIDLAYDILDSGVTFVNVMDGQAQANKFLYTKEILQSVQNAVPSPAN